MEKHSVDWYLVPRAPPRHVRVKHVPRALADASGAEAHRGWVHDIYVQADDSFVCVCGVQMRSPCIIQASAYAVRDALIVCTDCARGCERL